MSYQKVNSWVAISNNLNNHKLHTPSPCVVILFLSLKHIYTHIQKRSGLRQLHLKKHRLAIYKHSESEYANRIIFSMIYNTYK